MKKIILTLGEPAGIGPDLGVLLSKTSLDRNIVVIADPELIRNSALKLRQKVNINTLDNIDDKTISGKGCINVLPEILQVKNVPGKLNPKNSKYVIETIRKAAQFCINGEAKAMITGPISKSVLNKGGYKISGHTEFLADICKSESVMMLMNRQMKVALHTTHLPLSKVHNYVTKKSLIKTIKIIHTDLKKKFKIKYPKILVTGLNPHAGEDGILGKEDENIIKPTVKKFQNENIHIEGPVPADTAFLKKNVQKFDVIVTMYHDQGLPVIKFNDFKKTVNVTLGLPITRVSVDHGTALDLVGTGMIDISSFKEAIKVAKSICND